MYKLKKSSEVAMREAFDGHFKRNPAEFLERVKAQQVAVAVMCGDGFIGRQHAEQPAFAYIDTRVGGLPYSTGSIASATACLILMAEVAGLDPKNLPTYHNPIGLDTNDGYKNQAEEDARDIIKDVCDDIIADAVERGEITEDPFSDIHGLERRFEEFASDYAFGLIDSVRLLDELSEYSEGDDAVWEGQQPEDAIVTKAAYTFRNAVRSEIVSVFDSIRANVEATGVLDDDEVDATEPLKKLILEVLED